jgi:hypothetical protein
MFCMMNGVDFGEEQFFAASIFVSLPSAVVKRRSSRLVLKKVLPCFSCLGQMIGFVFEMRYERDEEAYGADENSRDRRSYCGKNCAD